MLIFGDKAPVSAEGFYLLDCLRNLTPVGHCELATDRRVWLGGGAGSILTR
jgi:hypothetical protein